MKTFSYEVREETGLHARPCALLVRQVGSFKSKVTLSAKGQQVEGTRMLALMGLGIVRGDVITFVIEGEDEETAAKQLETFCRENF